MAILPLNASPRLVQVSSDHIFPGASTPICEGLRTAYFISNPSELIPGLYCTLQPADTGIPILQQYLNSSWEDISTVIVGPPGQDGAGLTQRVVVSSASDLAGLLSSTVEYFIDGVIDMGSQEIEVPAGGLNLTGLNFNVSKLISSEDDYTMFTSPVLGSGDLLGKDYGIEVSGSNSRVYNLEDSTGFSAFEFARLNYDNCSSLGEITGYRQGLEVGTGRFGGKPTLKLSGTWLGGYFIDTSIVRNLDASMTGSLFEEGTNFVMESRFRSNQNIDLPASASFIDFQQANFSNASTLQLEGCIVTRQGQINPADSNITPNINRAELASAWSNNIGIPNTFEGGMLTSSSETTTSIGSPNTWAVLESTWTASDLQHMDTPSPGQIRHLGSQPLDYKVTSNLVIEGSSGDDIQIRLVRWNEADLVTEEVATQTRVINNFSGGRDVAFFLLLENVILNINDYVFLEVRNLSDASDVTLEIDSYFLIERR